MLAPRDDFYASHHPGPDEVLLVVEIADASLRYDKDIKTGLYAAWGVIEYWLADLPHNRLWCFSSPEIGVYRTVVQKQRGESIAPQRLPRCVIAVDALLIG